MPLVDAAHDSLPYIDVEASQNERNNAQRLITAELPKGYAHELHSSIPDLPEEQFSDLIQKELKRKAKDAPIEGGIDLSRYEAPDEPSADAKNDIWRSVLREAYTANSYLSGRHTNLTLLEEFGKNAWLIGNSQLEELLKDLEKEIGQLKEQTDSVNKERKIAQENSRGEIIGLEEAWKRGVDKIIEVQIATEALRQEILQRRRRQAT